MKSSWDAAHGGITRGAARHPHLPGVSQLLVVVSCHPPPRWAVPKALVQAMEPAGHGARRPRGAALPG